jgi:putative transposase
VAVLSYKHRLYPTRAQAALDRMLGAFCGLYNAALQQRIEAYRRQGKTLRNVDQAGELRAVREAEPALAGYSYSALQQVLRRLDKAFKGFFRRLRAGQKPGFPRFKPAPRFHAAEFRVGDGLTLRQSGRLGVVGIPGEVKIKRHRPLPEGARLGAAVLTRQTGKWYAVFQVELAEPGSPGLSPGSEREFAPVGIDVGLSSLVTLSTGEAVPCPAWTKDTARKTRRLNRVLARKKEFGSGWKRAKRDLARHHRKVANRRRDFLHKLSANLTHRFTHIAYEDLNIAGLACSMLAKTVHNAAWGILTGFIRYKAEWAGGAAKPVNPCGTTIEYSGCGVEVPKGLAERVHRCPDCGLVLDRNWNAARNVLSRASFGLGTSLPAPSGRVAA